MKFFDIIFIIIIFYLYSALLFFLCFCLNESKASVMIVSVQRGTTPPHRPSRGILTPQMAYRMAYKHPKTLIVRIPGGLAINPLHPRADTPPTMRYMPANTRESTKNGTFYRSTAAYIGRYCAILRAGDR